MSVIQEILSTPDGDESELEAAARAFVDAMKDGSFQHVKGFIEKEEAAPAGGEVHVVIEYVDPGRPKAAERDEPVERDEPGGPDVPPDPSPPA